MKTAINTPATEQHEEPIFIRSLTQLRGLNNVKKVDMLNIHISMLTEEEGFNVRDYTKERYVKHIDSLAHQWVDNPSMIPPLSIVVKDGKVMVRDGHCRRRGALKANAEMLDADNQIEFVPCVPFRGNDLDQDVLILSSQSGEKLDFVEMAVIYERLSKRGLTDAEIATKAKKSSQHVRMIRQIAMLPLAMQNYIANETISYVEAIDLCRDHGETKAVKIVNELVDELRAKLRSNAQAEQAAAPKVVELKTEGDAGTGLTDAASTVTTDAAPAAEGKQPADEPKVRITKSKIKEKVGGNKQRFTATVKTTTVSLVSSLSALIESGKPNQAITLTPELVASILALKQQLLDAKDEESGDAPEQHPHEALVETVGDAEPVADEEQLNIELEQDGEDEYRELVVVRDDDELGLSPEDLSYLNEAPRDPDHDDYL